MVHGACAWGLELWFASGPTFHSLPGIDSQLSIPSTPGTPAWPASLPNSAVRCCLPPLPARVEKVGCTYPRAYWEGMEATTRHWADSTPEYLAGDRPEKKKKLLLGGSEPLLPVSGYLALLAHRFKDPWGACPSAMHWVMGSWERGDTYLNFPDPIPGSDIGIGLENLSVTVLTCSRAPSCYGMELSLLSREPFPSSFQALGIWFAFVFSGKFKVPFRDEPCNKSM